MDLDKMNFDDFLEKDKTSVEKEKTLEERFAENRNEWKIKIENMSQRMKDIFKVGELLTEIYTERQIAVEYYHFLISIFSKVNKMYRKEWTEKYDFYSYKSQKRFPNEKTKELQILSEIEDILDKRTSIDNHIKYMSDTIQTIDNLIFGIKYKVEIEQISRGK